MVDEPTTPEEQERRLAEYISDNTQYEGLIIAIEDDVTDGMWAEFFADINTKRKEREKWFEDIKKPLNTALKELNAKEHLACDRLREVEGLITQARGAWMRVKLAKRKEADEAAITQAKETGGVAVLSQNVAKTVQTSSGTTIGLRTQPSWRLTDYPEITAKVVERDKIEFTREDPRLANVPDKAFVLKKGMIMPLLKTGEMPEGEHSIEKFDDFASISK